MDQIKFQQICEEVIHNQVTREGIGTLQEKTLHAVLKNYFERNKENQEVRVGPYVADIFSDKGIIEIQTGNFNTMRKKLDYFLKEYPVTIVYPIPHVKYLLWLDEETGEISNKRKSPKRGTPYMAFRELYKIKSFLKHSNLSICIVLLDIEEYRLLNGWSVDKKRGSSRYERIPIQLIEEILLERVEDYMQLVPEGLDVPFTSKDYSKESKLSRSHAQTALNILYYLEIVERVGKTGNTFLYETVEY